VLSAPAGFGKTTLLTECLAGASTDGAAVALLSLDRRDNDPVLLWTYVVTDMQTAVPGLGDAALQLLSSSSPPTAAALAARLSDDDVAAIEERTEGWIAALQLAALSLQGREDVSAFIAGFAGDDRYIVDYLVEEVLARQPAEVRDFLLRTSVLERLTGPLCDAVTGREGGKA